MCCNKPKQGSCQGMSIKEPKGKLASPCTCHDIVVNVSGRRAIDAYLPALSKTLRMYGIEVIKGQISGLHIMECRYSQVAGYLPVQTRRAMLLWLICAC